MIKIDKNIKMLSTALAEYPFNEMEIGDSFLVDDVKIVNFRNIAWRTGKKLKVKFSTKEITNGYRCWRVE